MFISIKMMKIYIHREKKLIMKRTEWLQNYFFKIALFVCLLIWRTEDTASLMLVPL